MDIPPVDHHGDDQRQGVTASTHVVLDLLDAERNDWNDDVDFAEQLRMASARAGSAFRAARIEDRRRYAVEAAARLLHALELIEVEL